MTGHLCPSLQCAMSNHGYPTAVPQWWMASPPLPVPLPPRCSATTRHTPSWTSSQVGLQCKYTPGHDGDHAASTVGGGDVFWPQDVTAEVTA